MKRLKFTFIKFSIVILFFVTIKFFGSSYHNPTYESVVLPELISNSNQDLKGFSCSGSYLRARQSFDQFGNFGPLFAGLGVHDFYQFCRLYPEFSQTTHPETINFIKNVCAGSFASVDVSPGGALVVNKPLDRKNMGLMLDGRLDAIEIEPQICWPIPEYGAFAFVRLPLRFSNVSKLNFVSFGPSGNDFANSVNQSISSVLKEFGISPLFQSAKVNSIGDVKLGIAWAGALDSDEPEFEKVSKCKIGIMGSAIFPTSTFLGYADDHLAAIPAGANGSFGVHGQIDCQIFIRSLFVLEALTESKVYFKKKQAFRAKVFAEQTAPFLTTPIEVDFDNGHFWRVYFGTRVGKEDGVFASMGYSYASREVIGMMQAPGQEWKEDKVLIYQDSGDQDLNFISTLASPSFVDDASKKVYQTYKNQVMALNQSFARQYAHALHLNLGMRAEMANLGRLSGAPCEFEVRAGVAYPFFGKNYIVAPALTGSIVINF